MGAYDFERVFPVDSRTEEKSREAGLHLWYLVRFDKNTDLKEAMERLSGLGEISKLQINPAIQRAYNPKKKPVPVSGSSPEQERTRAAADNGFKFNDALLPHQGDTLTVERMTLQQRRLLLLLAPTLIVRKHGNCVRVIRKSLLPCLMKELCILMKI